jgi:hypothetical protein
MKLSIATSGLLLLVTPCLAIASWFESCELTGFVSEYEPKVGISGAASHDITLTVNSARQTDDERGTSSYISCTEYIGSEQKVSVEIPSAVEIAAGGLLTVTRIAVDFLDSQSGEMLTATDFKFISYRDHQTER